MTHFPPEYEIHPSILNNKQMYPQNNPRISMQNNQPQIRILQSHPPQQTSYIHIIPNHNQIHRQHPSVVHSMPQHQIHHNQQIQQVPHQYSLINNHNHNHTHHQIQTTKQPVMQIQLIQPFDNNHLKQHTIPIQPNTDINYSSSHLTNQQSFSSNIHNNNNIIPSITPSNNVNTSTNIKKNSITSNITNASVNTSSQESVKVTTSKIQTLEIKEITKTSKIPETKKISSSSTTKSSLNKNVASWTPEHVKDKAWRGDSWEYFSPNRYMPGYDSYVKNSGCLYVVKKIIYNGGNSHVRFLSVLKKNKETNAYEKTGEDLVCKLVPNHKAYTREILVLNEINKNRRTTPMSARHYSYISTLQHKVLTKKVALLVFKQAYFGNAYNYFSKIKKNTNETDQEFMKRKESYCKRIIHDSLLGLQYLEHNNIVHNDIKASNILIFKGRYGPHSITAKITDFGHSVIGLKTKFEERKRRRNDRKSKGESISQDKVIEDEKIKVIETKIDDNEKDKKNNQTKNSNKNTKTKTDDTETKTDDKDNNNNNNNNNNVNDDETKKVKKPELLGIKKDENYVPPCGTDGHIAPELYLGQQDGIKSDIWSLGITMFTLLKNGKMPFGKYRKLNDLKTKYKFYMNNKKELDKTFGGVSWAAEDIMLRMLEYKVVSRPKICNLLDDTFFKASNIINKN